MISTGASPSHRFLTKIFTLLLWSASLLAHENPRLVPLDSLPTPTNVVSETNITITEEDFIPPPDWDALSPTILPVATLRAGQLIQLAKTTAESMDREHFADAVDRKKLILKFDDWGNGEVTLIDGEPCARVVHTDSKLSLLFVDADKIKKDSKHLRKYIARQHLDAGDKRPDGSRPGRDLVLVWTKNGEILTTDYHPREVPGSKAAWNDWWHATVSGVGAPEVVFGSFCAGLQVASAACVAYVKYYNDPADGFNFVPLAASAVWGFFIGTFNSTYRNFMYRGTESAKMKKLVSQSMMYIWSVYLFDEGAWKLINIMDSEMWLLHSTAIYNTYVHNQGRRAWNLLPEIRALHRDTVGTKKFNLFGRSFDTGIKQASWAQQMIYFIPYSIKLAGLMGLGIEWYYPGTQFKLMDAGGLMLLGSIPLAQFATWKYAEWKQFPTAGEIRQEFIDYWKRVAWAPITVPTAIFKFATNTLKKAGQIAGRSCKAALRLLHGDIAVNHKLDGHRT